MLFSTVFFRECKSTTTDPLQFDRLEGERILSQKLVPPQVLDGLRNLDAPTISNAIEFMKRRDPATGYASLEMKCQFPDLKPMLGYAFTVTADSVTAGDTRPLKLAELLDELNA